ncbi:sterile alpha motif domain-containing protein 9-like [Odontesthes bonariensis]|uniref:sterile alpha motif domain-containing protein 9-like n=1 Tax=Odontesthes bonariensis TaxID=219752 RepID=UPI003F58FA11
MATRDNNTDPHLVDNEQQILEYVQKYPRSTNTQLFSILALLKAYLPDSYLLMDECQKILGPPDPIHGGPPFTERMEPFTNLISADTEHICLSNLEKAKKYVEVLADSGISRSAIVDTYLSSLCGDEARPELIEFLKDLLTKREEGETRRDNFSRLITEITERETFQKAVSVLETASHKFKQRPIFPQTIARLYYIEISPSDYEKAAKWAKIAIERAPNNSYVADTLGHVYKNKFRKKAFNLNDVLTMADLAFWAFKEVEKKAEKEEGPEMRDLAGIVNISNSFNNRGLFGTCQVAKMVYEKLRKIGTSTTDHFPNLKMEIEDKFEFFEWYLSYSQPDKKTVEPNYFWGDVAGCYECYTEKRAADSTSFPGLLDCLNHGLFTSKGRRARFVETEKNKPELERIRDDLKRIFDQNVDDVKVAERYILSNIILSNKMPNSPEPTDVKELQEIIHRFVDTEVRFRSPEFYLLTLLLFWPEGNLQVVQQKGDEELKQEATEDNGLQEKTCDDEDIDEEQHTGGESAQLSPNLLFAPDLQDYVTLMEKAFEKYAKYLQGRYLLPLFFLGKGSGLSKWIHKSRLDAIVEATVDAELLNEQNQKGKKIDDLWLSGEVWHVPEIQDILLPVQVEPCDSAVTPQEQEEQEVFLCAGGKKIRVRTEDKPGGSEQSAVRFYLGFNIRGPVVFKVGAPDTNGDRQ